MKLRSDLPIKYYLNVHADDILQDDLAILFDIIQYIIKVIEIKQKQLTIENLKFSSKSLKYVFGDRLNDETFKQNLVKRIKSLILSENLRVDGETMYITQNGLTHFYIIQ